MIDQKKEKVRGKKLFTSKHAATHLISSVLIAIMIASLVYRIPVAHAITTDNPDNSSSLTDPSAIQPAQLVTEQLGSKAADFITQAFSDRDEFNSLVSTIKSTTNPTPETINEIQSYFAKMGPNYQDDPANVKSIERLQQIQKGELSADKGDINFLQHELLESKLVSKGIPDDYTTPDPVTKQVLRPAHDITRIVLGVDQPYHPSVIS